MTAIMIDRNVAFATGPALPLRSLLMAGAMALLLSACGVGNEAEEETDAARDPAVAGALEDELLVDPDLAESSNQNNALDPQGANSGAVPVTAADSRAAVAAANAEFAEEGMLGAPRPDKASDEDCRGCDGGRSGVTLGAKAAMQQGKGGCDAKLKYDAKWATRMPPEFNVYPQANVREAAGVENGQCDLRAVSFTSPAGIKDIVDYYFTKAQRGGYTAQYLVRDDGDHMLGGIRNSDNGAYVIFLRTLKGGATEVDIVASKGQ
ncbi:MAG: hypothetical protein AAFX04_03095 [Pseudomonadota bacterium]